MKEQVTKYIRGCILCCKSKLSNRKLGLYQPLPVPSRPWESIYMDFMGSLPMKKGEHDYLFVFADRFNKMCVLISCKNIVTRKIASSLFFSHVWVHFGLLSSIV